MYCALSRCMNKITPMHKTFTKEDLLRYIYGEMNREEREEIRSVILEDDTVQTEYLALKEAKECLNKGRLSPSKFAVNNIMSYAKALMVKPSKHLSTVDFVLN